MARQREQEWMPSEATMRELAAVSQLVASEERLAELAPEMEAFLARARTLYSLDVGGTLPVPPHTDEVWE